MHNSFFLTFYYDDFKTEKLKELYNEHLYLHHLDSTANIFFLTSNIAKFALSHIYPSLYPSVNPPYYFDAFQSKLKTSVHFTPKHFSCMHGSGFTFKN